jgi:hypothetical protein
VLKSEWVERFPGKNAEGMIEFLNNFNLGMDWGQKGKMYWVATGEKVLLERSPTTSATPSKTASPPENYGLCIDKWLIDGPMTLG